MIVGICISIFLGFVASRLGVMVYDFMCYREIFGGVKFWIAKKVDPTLLYHFYKDTPNTPKTDAQDRMNEAYDLLSNKDGFFAFLLRLTECNLCLTIWFSFLVSIPTVLLYDVNFEAIFLTPIFGYFITEKLA